MKGNYSEEKKTIKVFSVFLRPAKTFPIEGQKEEGQKTASNLLGGPQTSFLDTIIYLFFTLLQVLFYKDLILI